MTRPHLIAKLILLMAGIHLLMHSLSGIISIVSALHQNFVPETLTLRVCIEILKTIVTLVMSLLLLFWSGWLVRILTGQTPDRVEIVSNRWIIAGFRFTVCFCGLLCFYNRILMLFYYVPAIIKGPNALSYTTLQGQTSLISAKILVGILVEIAAWIITIYLILGAPHYINWQLRSSAVKQGVKI